MKTQLETALAKSFILSFKAQSFHWNVNGVEFHSLHALFAEVYETLDAHKDVLAELIRIMGQFAPTQLKPLIEKESEDTSQIPEGKLMCKILSDLLASYDQALIAAHSAATDAKKFGHSSELETLIAQTEKLMWKLKASSMVK